MNHLANQGPTFNSICFFPGFFFFQPFQRNFSIWHEIPSLSATLENEWNYNHETMFMHDQCM
jgi:hypothetical protein